MKSNSEIKSLFMNSGLPNKFFFNYFDIDFDRIGYCFYEKPIKNHDGVEMANMDDKTKQRFEYPYCVRLHRHNDILNISSYDQTTFRIQIFLDQYGYLGRQLPVFSEEVIASNMIWQNKYKTYDEVRQAMQIMLKPLNTYDDFIERVKEIEVFRQWQIIRPEMLPLGNINNWSWGNIGSELGGITIQQTDESEWQFIPWERGYAQSPSITFFREQAIYAWFVNLYLGLL